MAVKIDSIFDLSNVFSLGYLGVALSKYAAEQDAITTHSAFTPLFFVVIVLLVVTVFTVLPVLFGKVAFGLEQAPEKATVNLSRWI